MREEDLEEMRSAGLGDDEVLDAALITAYFNFVNRLAVGLGVELSAEEMAGYKT
jgi:alkylhydroperoxidase family enzyme